MNQLEWRDEEDVPELMEIEGGDEGEGGREAAVIHREYSLHWNRNRIAQAPEGF